MQDFDRSEHDVLGCQCSSSLDSENEFGIILTNNDRLRRQFYISCKLCALLAERAISCVLNFNGLLEVI